MSSGSSTFDMVVFTAPSGAGKTTIVKHLLEKYSSDFSFSISATTRKKREKETHGKDYYFMDIPAFKAKIEAGEFAEWEEVYNDQYYGTLNSEIERIIADGKKVIFDIEVNGAQSIKDAFDERCLVVFVKPPSFRELVNRLINRKSESPDSLRRRINRIKKELLFEQTFDLVLLNDELDITFREAEKIIEKHVLKQA